MVRNRIQMNEAQRRVQFDSSMVAMKDAAENTLWNYRDKHWSLRPRGWESQVLVRGR